MGWQFELGRFTSAPKGGGWNHTYGCSQVSYNWTGVSEPSRLTWASSGGGQVLQSTRHVTTEQVCTTSKSLRAIGQICPRDQR